MKNLDHLGVMIDCSRNAVMKPEALKKYIKLLSVMGYDKVQLYTEDTYEIEGEPYFGYLRGRYSISQLKEIDEYAQSVGIELEPCIQTLAHLNSIMRWDRYRDNVRDCDDILLMGEEKTYELIEKMFASLRSAFSSKSIHIGMDEAYFVGLGKYRKIHGDEDRMEAMLKHLSRVCQIAQKYDFQPMMWNDMFFRLSDGTQESNEKIRALIPENVSLVYWDYYRLKKQEYTDRIKANLAICDRVKFAGGAWCWSGFAPINRFSIEATKQAFSACIDGGIREAYITMWGDDGHECSKYSVLPTLAWAACLAEDENVTEEQVRQKFSEWTGEDYDDFLLLDTPNEIGRIRAGIQNPSKYLLYADPFLGVTDHTVDNADPGLYREYAKKLSAAAARSNAYGYVFKNLAMLCDLLALKCDLGIRTRAAYKAADKEALSVLAQRDYPAAIYRLNKFYEQFETQWNIENSPFGFDVQDIRLGGLERRLTSCARRLAKYVSSELSSIPELEEEILPYTEKAEKGQALHINSWYQNCTQNVISH